MNRKSEAAREIAAERRTIDRERTVTRHAARDAKYQPTRGIAGAW